MKLTVPYKIIGNINPTIPDAFLSKIEHEDWFTYDYRNSKSNMQNCRSIMLRHSSEYATDTIREMPLFKKFEPELMNVLKVLKLFYSYSEYVAFLVTLQPGGTIGDHFDSGEFLERIHRIHIPIVTNANCFYRVDGEKVNMQVGKIYEIDNTRIHGVENNGTQERIHLIVNLYPILQTA